MNHFQAGLLFLRTVQFLTALGLCAFIVFLYVTGHAAALKPDWKILALSALAAWLITALILVVNYRRKASLISHLHGVEQRHRAILETAVDGIVVIDSKGLIQSVNPAAVKLFGYQPEELLGKNINILMPQSYAVHHDTYLQNYLKTGIRKIIGIGREVHGKRKDGTEFPLDLAVSEIQVNGNRMFTGMVRDITDRQIYREVKHLKSTLDLTMDSIFMFDPVELKFFYTNQAAQRSVGYSEEELHSMTPLDIKPRFTEASFRAMIEPMMAGPNQMHQFETVHKHKSGALIPVEIILQYVAPEGEPPRFSAIVRDISERVQAQQALIDAKERAEVATVQKSQFLAHMSHEIRTPMSGVLGMLELLQEAKLDPNAKRWVRIAGESATSLLTIINDILDLSKIEAGQLRMENVSMNLHQLVEGTAALQASLAASKGLQLNCYVGEGVPLEASGDPVRLRQVLLNLLNNAVKFTYVGEVTLTVELMEELEEEVMLRFEVKDTGIGLTPIQQERLFEAFSQADDSTTRKFGGTGLGLNISRQLVHRMGGSISLESQPGEGTSFWFTCRLGKVAGARESPEKFGQKDSRILIADHNETARNFLQRYLGHAQLHAVSCVGSSEAALAAIRTAFESGWAFQYLFLDTHLPGSGWQKVLEEVRQHESLRSLRVVLISSFGDPELLSSSTPVEAHLVKPIRKSELFAVLRDSPDTEVAKPDYDSEKAMVFRGFRVLLADDSLINQIVCREMLQMLGMEVTTVENGQLAFDALGKDGFDLLLIDCHMPVLDGFAATRLIRAREEKLGLSPIPILAVTARAMEGDKEDCLEAGMDDYLSKPLRFDKLVECLSRWLPVGEKAD